MASHFANISKANRQRVSYIETLMLIAGIEVVLTWTMMISFGLSGAPGGTIDPITSILAFAIAGLGLLEFGVVVWNVQLTWLLPQDHDQAGESPFLCGYCLLGQLLLMFPPSILVALVCVPVLLFCVSTIGWYVQKFTSLRLAYSSQEEFQKPLGLRELLMMPVYSIGLGLFPVPLTMIFRERQPGLFFLTYIFALLATAFVPVILCYAFLYLCRYSWKVYFAVVFGLVSLCLSAVTSEMVLNNGKSSIALIVSAGVLMFVAGLWIGYRQWLESGMRVVIAKPLLAQVEIRSPAFDELL